MAFTNGKHPYNGSFNDRAKRQRSKLYKGIKVDHKATKRAFELLEEENKLKSKR